MSRRFRLAILSDIHYAGPREQAEGDDYEYRVIENPFLRFALRQYRRHIWLRHPLQQNGQLDRFLAEVPTADCVIANGDYSCNTAAYGLSDDAALESAREGVGKLRRQFGDRLQLSFGDHELGKLRLMGTRGGMRLQSWQRGIEQLGIAPFWKLEVGHHLLLSCTATLLALPVFAHDLLPAERAEWEILRAAHFAEVRAAFAAVRPEQRILLFCHDPTALPFLARDEVISAKIPQIERTVIGHLHSNLYLRLSRILSGMPAIKCFGHSIHRMSTALRKARHWRRFNVLLCPSLAGIELLKDGGYFTVDLDLTSPRPAEFHFHALKR
jgi:hypothetical protein